MKRRAYGGFGGASRANRPAALGYAEAGPASRRQQDPRYLSSGSLVSAKGLTREPLSQAAQWRCGPVARPDWPTVPITSPRFTRAPSLTVAVSRWKYMVNRPRP